MKGTLSSFKPRRQISVRAQITTSLREMLVDGRLKEGDRLPSSRELSTLWKAPEPTVQRALVPLVKEGLLIRTPKVGTFVRKREKRLTSVGIYAPDDLWRNSSHAFGRALCNELHGLLAAEQLEESVWVDPRSAREQDHPWEELLRAAAERRFQVLIAPCVDGRKIAWLEKLPVPVVYLSSAILPNRVTLDTGRWAESALGLLAEQGCRRVGAICSFRRQEGVVDAGLHDYSRFFDALGKSAGRLGMELREEWVFQPEGSFANTAVEIPEFGFRSMQRLWKLKERPEGLVVFDDVTAAGVLMAVMREQISVPGELKLVLHRNAEVGLFCPVPASFLDIRIKGVAEALLQQALRLYNGDEISMVQIAPSPVRGLAVQTL